MSGIYGYSGNGGTHAFDSAEERDEFAEMFDEEEIEPWRERFYDEVEGQRDWEQSWWRREMEE
ncbi:MAG: hypothetical protein IKL97_03725 [Eggerthellaceae bacterium]|nr:hypothetical protein [Eggerthellaceae bacterium]